MERLSGQRAHLHHCTQQMRLVRDRFFHHGVQLDSLQPDDIFRCAWRCRPCAQSWSSDWRVVTEFGVWVIRVKCKSNLPRWWTFSNLVFVCHIHEVVPQAIVVMVLEPTWRELACRDFDVWLGETRLGISTQLPCDTWRTLKTCQRMSGKGGGSLRSHFM